MGTTIDITWQHTTDITYVATDNTGSLLWERTNDSDTWAFSAGFVAVAVPKYIVFVWTGNGEIHEQVGHVPVLTKFSFTTTTA